MERNLASLLPRIRRKKLNFGTPSRPCPKSIYFGQLLRQYEKQNRKEQLLKTVNKKVCSQEFDINEIIKEEQEEEVSQKEKEEERKKDLQNKKVLKRLYANNFSGIMDVIKNEKQIINTETKKNLPVLKSPSSYRINTEGSVLKMPKKFGFEKYKKTKYTGEKSMKEFYMKYAEFNNLFRKYEIKFTPSIAFIKSTSEEKIIPNPLGLVKRTGDDNKIAMNYQKVGDNYINALSNSLKYSDNITSLDLSANRLSSEGVSSLFTALNENLKVMYSLVDINLSENNIGQTDITQMLNFLQNPKNNIEHLNLFGNQIGDENAIKILQSVGTFIEYKLISLNLGKNNIHDNSKDAINFMVKKCSELKILNLSNNWLHNKAAAEIINQLSTHYYLRILDLSWNNIGDDLVINPTYEELVNDQRKYPNKNFDNFTLDEALFKKALNIRRNPLLPVLDMSKEKKDNKKKVNTEIKIKEYKEPKKIPEKPKNPSNFAIALGEYFSNVQVCLVHLDISHNSINSVDCKYLSEKAKNNHDILGMHVDGNEMEINELGFLIPLDKNEKNDKYFCESHISYGISTTYNLRKTQIDSVRKIRNKNNCWICDGFREIEFEYIPEEYIDNPNNHLVKLHLSFDDYKPFDMLYNGKKFYIVRMCPPGDIDYFFTVDTIPVKKEGKDGKNDFKKIINPSEYIKYTFNDEYMEELKNIRDKLIYEQKQIIEKKNPQNTSDNNTRRNSTNAPKSPPRKGSIDFSRTQNKKTTTIDLSKIQNPIARINPNVNATIIVNTISKIKISYNKNVINEDYRKMIKFSEPRPEKLKNKFIKPKTPWSFPKSIWAYYGYNYEGETEEYLNKCFKFDFDRCQFSKDFKSDSSYLILQEMLRARYRDIIDCYKYYSSFGGTQIWQITQNNLTEFVNRCKGLCDKTYDINNVFLTVKNVCANPFDKEEKKRGNKNLSDNIVRHQFMNLLVKVSKDKYITILKQTKDPLEAVKMAFDNSYDEAIKGFNYHKWRIERYYNEQVDNFLKAFLPILDAVYLSWARQKGPRKKDVWMTLDEFNVFVTKIVDVNEYPLRENPYIFNMSINLQINEIFTDKHINMYLPEFLEALCRVIDKASPISVIENKEDWPMEKRQKQPLINKLENILPYLIKLIDHPDFKNLKDKFPIPPKDISTGLYVLNYNNPFYQGYIIKIKEETVDIIEGEEIENVEENKEDKEENEEKEEKKEEGDGDEAK